MKNKERIDLYLVNNHFCETRSQAQEMINFGLVIVNNIVINKCNYMVDNNDVIHTLPLKFVSRAGYKLETGLKNFNIDLTNKVVLDIGASTGGFTDCCLQNNCKFVYCLDVGTNQLHPKIKNKQNIKILEQTNLKLIPNLNFELPIDVVVCDVSFISLKHVFEAITKLYNPNLIMIFLIKPEFELDEKIIKKTKGVIKNPKHHNEAIERVKHYAQHHKIELIKIIESPIKGKKLGNTEFIGLFKCQK